MKTYWTLRRYVAWAYRDVLAGPARQLYGRAVKGILASSGTRVVTWPALAAATIRSVADAKLHPIAGPALVALGPASTPWNRWVFRWTVAYHDEVDRILGEQQERLTPEWQRRHLVPHGGQVPEGGAILVILHQANQRLLAPLLRDQCPGPVGMIAQDALEWPPFGHGPLEILQRDTYHPHLFDPELSGVIAAYHFLREGGYLVVNCDLFSPARPRSPLPEAAPRPPRPSWPRFPLLGKAIALSPGPVELATLTGVPIIPCVLVPRGSRWHLWRGTPIPPMDEDLAAARDKCLRKAPLTWHFWYWQDWYWTPPGG